MSNEIALQPGPSTIQTFNPSAFGDLRRQGVLTRTLGLCKSNSRWRTHSEIVLALGSSKGDAEWALSQLVDDGKLEVARVDMGGIVSPFNKYRARAA